VSRNCGERFKSTVFITVVFLCCSLQGSAQEKSLGLRLGWGGGLSFVTPFEENQDIELILSPRWGGLILTGLYEIKMDLDSENWNWYYGGGMHLGFHHRNNFIGEGFNGDQQYINMGFDLIVGVKYRMQSLPVELSADFKPSVELLAERNLLLEELAVSCRYLF
jgi:hypothetical protein